VAIKACGGAGEDADYRIRTTATRPVWKALLGIGRTGSSIDYTGKG